MLLHFYKMNGAGNDFVLLDNRDLSLQLDAETIELLCDRHRGIGADGLLLVEPPQQGADFRFRYYNADGGEAEMCGNGARCFGRFTAHLSDEPREKVSFETSAGVLEAHIVGENVRIAMSVPKDLRMGLQLDLPDHPGEAHFINTGVPHVVMVAQDLAQVDVFGLGQLVRFHSEFAPAGTNANWMQAYEPQHIAIRTYERGVEDETLACGTGVTACALIHHRLTQAPSPIRVDVAGGDTLIIGFEVDANGQFTHVTLTGPADFVFEGEIEI